MASKQSKVQHVVAIPYPAQGHINPLLQFCQQLVPHGFTFTFINTHHIHQRLQHSSHIHPAGHEDDHIHDTHHGPEAPAHGGHYDEDAQAHQDQNIHIPSTHNEQTAHPDNAYHGEDACANGAHPYKGCGSIHMVFVAGGCAPELHAHISSSLEAFKAAQEMKEPVEILLTEIMKEQEVSFILSDILLGWSNDTALKFGLPWVAFWPASTATCSAFIYFHDLAAQGEVISVAEKKGGEAPLIQGIPGLPPTHLDDLPKVWDDTGKLYHEVLKYFQAAEQASFLLFNTFAELEGQVLEALSTRFPVLAIGPVVPSRYMMRAPDSEEEPFLARPSLFREDTTCLEWLDKQAPASVLFISFGSISLRSEEQLEELAQGVEASGCPYLWVRRPDPTSDISVSEGGRTQEGYGLPDNGKDGRPRGLIVPWAPQLQVLSHPSVGGFITHCGWNSIIESVSMGVPMLCWADTGERMSNQRFVVQFWKCGLDMVVDSRRTTQHIDEAVLVRRDEVEKSVRFLMFEEAGASIRARATQLRDAAIVAFQNSSTHLNEFAQAMEQKSLHTLV